MSALSFTYYPALKKDCEDCRLQECFKEDWEPHHGSVSDWIAILETTTLDSCQDWMRQVDRIRWTSEEAKILYSEYVKHVSSLSAQAYKEHTPAHVNTLCAKLYSDYLNANTKIRAIQ